MVRLEIYLHISKFDCDNLFSNDINIPLTEKLLKQYHCPIKKAHVQITGMTVTTKL